MGDVFSMKVFCIHNLTVDQNVHICVKANIYSSQKMKFWHILLSNIRVFVYLLIDFFIFTSGKIYVYSPFLGLTMISNVFDWTATPLICWFMASHSNLVDSVRLLALSFDTRTLSAASQYSSISTPWASGSIIWKCNNGHISQYWLC